MEILEKAKELGVLISESDAMKNLKDSELMVCQDEKAKRLIEEHKNVQMKLMQALRGNASKEELESLKSKVTDKLRELNGYNVTRYFLDSKKEFDSLIKDVNNIMTYEITGKQACDAQHCSSCGGCR